MMTKTCRTFSLRKSSKKCQGWATFQKYNEKWNKIMASVFCVFIFSLLFAIVLVNTTTNSANVHNSLKQDLLTFPNQTFSINLRSYGGEGNTVNCQFRDPQTECHLQCDYGNLEKLGQIIDASMQSKPECNKQVDLTLYNVKFTDNEIKPYWIQMTSKINILTIIDTFSITCIKPQAFNSLTFQNIKKLSLRSTNLETLENETFTGLINLETLHISNVLLQGIQPGALDAINKIVYLEFDEIRTNGQLDLVKNVTGAINLKYLEIVSIRFNNLGSVLNKFSFVGLTAVKCLYLSDSKIDAIGEGTFDVIAKTIELIDLKNNKLMTLPTGILDSLLSKRTWQINLANNLWNCNCQLLELKGYLINYPTKFTEPVTCYRPVEGIFLTSLPFYDCHIPSPTPPAETPEPDPVPTDRFTCEHLNYKEIMSYKQDYLDIKSKIADIVLHESLNNNADLLIEIITNEPEYSLIWFSDKNYEQTKSLSINCLNQFNRTIQMSNLTRNVVYVFCVIVPETYTISPLDCRLHYIKDIANSTDSTTDWNLEDAKTVIIVVFIVSVLVVLFIGFFMGMFLVRKCHVCTVVKSQHQIDRTSSSTNSSKTESMIMSDFCKNEYPVQNSNAIRPNFMRSTSETSLASCRSYVTAVTPSPFEIVQWRLERTNKMNRENSIYMDKLAADLPPPLPPYPRRKSKQHQCCALSAAACNKCKMDNKCTYDTPHVIQPYSTSYA